MGNRAKGTGEEPPPLPPPVPSPFPVAARPAPGLRGGFVVAGRRGPGFLHSRRNRTSLRCLQQVQRSATLLRLA